jgi:hypothetical protein
MPTIPRLIALFLIGPILALGTIGGIAQIILFVMHGVRVGKPVSTLVAGIAFPVLVILAFVWIFTRIYFRKPEEE